VLATDIRFDGDKAILGHFEVGLGSVPGGGPMARLARLVGRGRAAEILLFLVDRATGCQVGRAAGVESQLELADAGLHQLCSPYLARIDKLPAPQRAALGTAFGLRPGGAPDRFVLGLAVRTVEWHLRKIFTKLGVNSRRQLRRLPHADRR
jgi:hypothetical protein